MPRKPAAPITAADASDPTASKPRLLVLASTFPANAADSAPAFVRDLAGVQAGVYDTTVLVPSVPGAARTEQIGAVCVRRFRYFPRRYEDLADGAILENLRSRRSRWLQVPCFLVAETVAVRRAVRELRPDVIHVHWIIPQGVAALLGARCVPMLVTTLGGDVYGLRDPLSRRLKAMVLRRARLVTTMNEDMRQNLIDAGARPEAVLVLPMGADVRTIQARGRGVAAVPGRILLVGRLVEKKGTAVLLEALRELDVPGVELHIVGDGPLRAALEAQAEGLAVRFLGALHRDALAQEYAAASVVVFPSVPAASGDQDGLPVALLEAMAAARAVVVSDLPGLRDTVVDGVSGLGVPAGDAAALGAAVRRLLGDAALREALGAGAARRAEDFSVESIGARYVGLLNDVRTLG